MIVRFVFLGILSLLAARAAAAVDEALEPEIADIFNYIEYSDTFSSSGQPTLEQLQLLADSGFQRVVNIAFTSEPGGIPNADQKVKGLGMEYMQIPVSGANPLPSDFYAFADSMQRDTSKKTLLHCSANARATAFAFLYRVIYEDVDIAEAKADMNIVWQPFENWTNFIFAVLDEHGISADCEGCDWTPGSIQSRQR